MQKKIPIQKPTIIDFFFGTLVALFRNNVAQDFTDLPVSVVGRYQLESRVTKDHGLKNFFTGIYTNNNNKVFIKTWRGKIKDINYFLLVNEYIVGVILSEKMRDFSKKTTITFPRIVDCFVTTDTFSIIYEYIPGVLLNEFSKTKQTRVLSSAIRLFSDISETLKKEDKKYISQRSYLFYFISFPLIVTAVLLLNREKWKIIMSSFWESIDSIPSVRYAGLMLAHRDLNPNNIMLDKDRAYILDCERIVLTVPYFDTIHILIARANRHIKHNLYTHFQRSSAFPNDFLKNYICLHYILSLHHMREAKNYYFSVLSGTDTHL